MEQQENGKLKNNDLDLVPVKNSKLSINVRTTEDNIQDIWGVNKSTVKEVEKTIKRTKMTHGMFASVPMICKGDTCPFINTCDINVNHRILNQRCPQEIGLILARFEMYCEHFGIEIINGEFAKEDIVDASLIRDLVDYEVQIFRAENKTALRGDFLGLKISTVSKTGKPYYEEVVTPEANYKNILIDKKFKTLNLLNATRKDKAAMMQKHNNPSVKAINIFKKIEELAGDQEIYEIEDTVIVEGE